MPNGPARACRPSSSGRPPSPRPRRRRRRFGAAWQWTRSSYDPYPRFRPLGRRGRRIQRQVHGRPDRAARQQRRHAARPRARQLPQLLPAGRALAVQRAAAGAGPVTWTSPTNSRPACRAGRARVSPKWFYDAAGSAAVRAASASCPSTTRRAPSSRCWSATPRRSPQRIGPQRRDRRVRRRRRAAKVRLLLDALDAAGRAIVPVDISGEHLPSGRGVAARRPPRPGGAAARRPTSPRPLDAAPAAGSARRLLPRQFDRQLRPAEAAGLLRALCARWLRGGGLLIGVDLVKDPARAARRLQRRARRHRGLQPEPAGARQPRARRRLRPGAVAHSAFYNAALRRIEMHLVSRRAQRVTRGRRRRSTSPKATACTPRIRTSTPSTASRQLAPQRGLVGRGPSGPTPSACFRCTGCSAASDRRERLVRALRPDRHRCRLRRRRGIAPRRGAWRARADRRGRPRRRHLRDPRLRAEEADDVRGRLLAGLAGGGADSAGPTSRAASRWRAGPTPRRARSPGWKASIERCWPTRGRAGDRAAPDSTSPGRSRSASAGCVPAGS